MTNKSKHFIQKTFSSRVSSSYEHINHILTFGFDTLWRKQTARMAAEKSKGPFLDVCTGTGETVAYLNRYSSNGTKIFALDLSSDMMAEALKKKEAQQIGFTQGDVKSLPFADASIDIITISFATRNINLNQNLLVQTFKEFYRILKPGGSFINLETSQPSSKILRLLFHLYIKLMVKPIGGFISGSFTGYAYLSHTIPRFYDAVELKELLHRAGFMDVSYKKLLGGISAMHIANKRKQ